MMLSTKHDRFPPRRLKACVDAIRFSAHFVQEVSITVDVRAAWRANLHKRKPLLVARAHLEEALQGAEPFENPLGVVDAIHANSKQRSIRSELLEQSRPLRSLAG